jgi:hypothetical protein
MIASTVASIRIPNLAITIVPLNSVRRPNITPVMSAIEKPFTYLQDNVPQWLQDVTSMEEKVVAMQQENSKIQMSQSPLGKQRSDSIESIRSARLNAIAENTPPSNGTNTDLAGSRKRKSLSVSSGRVSNSLRHRKTMVVVNYDGDMQKSFELLVRAIGTGRHMLRKAICEVRMTGATAQASSSEDDDDGEEEDEAFILSKNASRAHMYRIRARATAIRSGRPGGIAGCDEVLSTTDKTLEQSQELCEKAAHLILRDGDCRKELEGVRKAFEALLETAKTEVEKCNALKSQETPELQAHEASDTSVSSNESPSSYWELTPHSSLPESELQPQSKTTLPEGSTAPNSSAPKIVDIEVDDDDETDDDFVMPPVRLTSRFNR